MFYRDLTDEIELRLTVPLVADDLFALTDRNREFLKQWLPWLDGVKQVADTRSFIDLQQRRFQQGEALHATIVFRGAVAGVAGFDQIDRANRSGVIGYWLGEAYTGRGIMTRCVRALIETGWHDHDLNRIEIRCAVENHKSRAIPERLGFLNEGTLRQAENLYGRFVDLVVYGLLRDDWARNGVGPRGA